MALLPVSLACMYAYSAPMSWPFVIATFSATSMVINVYQMTVAAKRVVKSIEVCEDGKHVKMVDFADNEFLMKVKDF